ncbi:MULTISPECIES: hypothetical protein [Sphingobacterium]|uniref:hypothetical protein n=1 Tax=Sphingobacterium TaxID=28453 RepID=UPI00257D32F0|nr:MULTISPECIES: hypothetical protein [Sphingobacterium]
MEITPSTLNKINESLSGLLQRRIGGSVNIKGIHYQVLYGCYILLKELSDSTNIRTVTLEGIEDIDLNCSKIYANDSVYIQLKSSVNKMDAGSFWTMGVLQNFIDAYLKSSQSRFKLVYNMHIANGNLSTLINRKEKAVVPNFWIEKIKTYNANVDCNDFFSKVSFEFQPLNDLYAKIQAILIKDWNINIGTELQFLRSIFYHILIWSKERKKITYLDLNAVIQEVKDSYSKAHTNEAVKNNWIIKVDYDSKHNYKAEDYYDGKAARPQHIALGLPVKRKVWQKQIIGNVSSSDVVLIKSSSGQGKSTLAWQTGFQLCTAFTVYQINNCKSSAEVNSIAEFIESRILIGEILLVIIDGLTTAVEAWPEVVRRTMDTTAKFIITSREEDWHRYGADISRINISIVDIYLSFKEAGDIYEQLKRKGKIYPGIKEWQPLWERVSQKGLLIEFTFLLTQGQMIEERLSYQLNALHNTKSSGAKLEILRMATLADCLSIRLKTSVLLKYVKDEIGFDQDRDFIISELEKEYLINFDSQYIEGLHPIRSGHMKNLLHKNIPIEMSLINLFKLIDSDSRRHDFFINAPDLLTKDNKQQYYDGIAELLYEGKYSDMVYALDGIMHSEPRRYWSENRAVFDEAYSLGGIEIFSLGTVPFSKIDSLEQFANLNWDKAATFRRFIELKQKLPTYSFENTEVFLFAKVLQAKLNQRKTLPESYEGLEFLIRWFNALNINTTFPSVSQSITISNIVELPLNEAKELMLYFRISDLPTYQKFIEINRNVLISYLKYHTGSLTIEEADGNVQMNYVLADNELDRINELSMYRINLMHAFFPYFNLYSTEAILLPFPSEEIIAVTRNASIKKLSSEAIGDTFNQHLNKLWTVAITRNYEEGSAYAWQNSILNVRQLGIAWAKNSITFVDSLLEGNLEKRKKSASTIDQRKKELANALALRKAYPSYERKYFEPKDFADEQATIDSWLDSLAKFNSQLLNIFLPEDEQARHVALINLKALYLDLQKMQQAFAQMEHKTIAYFDSGSLCIDENTTYKRMYTSVLYYVSHLPLELTGLVHVGRVAVEDWWKTEESKLIRHVDRILKKVEQSTTYRFITSNSSIETSTLTYYTFGVENIDLADADVILSLSSALSGLKEAACDFFTIISVKNSTATGAVRFRRDFFSALSSYISGDPNISLKGLFPLPVALSAEILSTLPDISMPDIPNATKKMEMQVKILIELWQLSEHRIRLNKKSEIEEKWLEEAEYEYAAKIQNSLSEITDANTSFTHFLSEGLRREMTYSKAQILAALHECLQIK